MKEKSKKERLQTSLNQTVDEYLYNEDHRKEITVKYSHDIIDRELFYETMKAIEDFRWTCLKVIDMKVSRILKSEDTVNNETALELYHALHGMTDVEL